MSGYIGNAPVPFSTQTRQTFVASSGQTSFATAGYTAGFVDVYMNGVKLVDGASNDFVATNGSEISLTSGASTGDIIDVLMFTAVDLATAGGGGRYKGERGTLGPAAAAGDIFRVNEQTLNTNVTIDATENASCAGPLALATGVTLTVNGNLTVV